MCVQSPSKAAVAQQTPREPAGTKTSKRQLQEVFLAFATFGGRQSSDGATELDGAKFAKLCRECLLLNAGFTSTSVDIIFSKVKAKVRNLTEWQWLLICGSCEVH